MCLNLSHLFRKKTPTSSPTAPNASNTETTNAEVQTAKMHITVVPASTKTSQAAIRTLLADASGPTVRGVYRNLARVPEEFKVNPRFEAMQGDIEDADSLDFSGSDAVMTVQPPHYDGRDTIAHAKKVSENTKAAIQKAGSVKRLVYISSQGAQYDQGTVGSHGSDSREVGW